MSKWSLTLLLIFSSPALAGELACMGGQAPVILVVGDSLSAGYGIDLDEGWVALLGQRLAHKGYEHRVVNASVSGDTTSGGVARLSAALDRHSPALVVIELGGNDGLRGLPLKIVEKNFDAMIRASQKAGAEVALLGMRIPSNYGRRYAAEFHGLYGRLAERHKLALVDFFLQDVALDKSLMQADGIHPNALAQPKLLANVWPAIEATLAVGCAAES